MCLVYVAAVLVNEKGDAAALNAGQRKTIAIPNICAASTLSELVSIALYF